MPNLPYLQALSDPYLVGHYLYYNFYRKLLRRTGVQVTEKDWDNLIILDACRYDIFERNNEIDGDLQSVESKGSHTVEFLKNNFKHGKFHDIVYVSATPQLQWVGLSDSFHDVIHVWEDNWDKKKGTVPPDKVRNLAIEASREYPNKRLIIHFVQPHYPFIGKTGREIRETISARSGIDGYDEGLPTVWDYLENKSLSREKVWNGYEENLKVVFNEVDSMLDQIKGKSVITSDHGNCFGESGLYGHPGKKAVKHLIKVPWLVIESNQRKEIIKEDPVRQDNEIDDQIEDRLADLGYMN